MNISDTMKLAAFWKRFQAGHPKFPAFVNAVRQEGLREGTVIEIGVTTPEGKRMVSNLRLTAEDLEMIGALTRMKQGD